jgi:hypothetical protein
MLICRYDHGDWTGGGGGVVILGLTVGAGVPLIVGFALAEAVALADGDELTLADLCGLCRPFCQP